VVYSEFADRDPHPADALVAEAENTFAVGDDDHFDVVVRDVLQDIVEVVPVLIGDKNAARATVDLREAFAGGADGRGIDNRHHLIEMVANQAIKRVSLVSWMLRR
jgi:hypothetical protein